MTEGVETLAALDIDFDPVAAAEKVAKKTTIFELHIGTPGFKKSIDSAHFMKTLEGLSDEQLAELSPEMKKMVAQVRSGSLALAENEGEENGNLDPSMIHVSQDLIDKKAIAAIKKRDKQFTNWVKSKTVPSPIKFQGAYLMRLSEVKLITEATKEYMEEREALVKAFGDKWDAVVADAQTKRGPFFDSEDYPPFETASIKYDVEYRWMNFNVPEALKTQDDAIFAAEAKKAQAFYADAFTEARDAARVSFQSLTDHLLDQLGNDESGKPKRFMGGSLNKIIEFVEIFCGGGDLTDDNALQSVALKAKSILSGVDAAQVRKEDGLRTSLQTAVEAIKTEAAKLVTVGQRKFAKGAYGKGSLAPAPLSID